MSAILFGVFFVGLFVGLPVSISMGLSGMAAVLVDGRFMGMVVPQYLFNGISSFPLMAVPFFILAAELLAESGLTTSLMKFANDLVGHIRGGLGHVNVLMSMLFAGVSGSALADAAGPGAIEMSMMRKAGYDAAYAGALSAATATIGPIIPPSILMVIYAISDSRVTVAGLFLAGVVPGVLLGLALSAVNHYVAIKRGYLFRSRRPTLRGLAASFWQAIPALMLPFIIMFGILAGIFTPTEAAAVAVAYALFIGLFVTRGLKWGSVLPVFTRSGIMTAAVLLIVSMASIFSWLLTILQIPQTVAGRDRRRHHEPGHGHDSSRHAGLPLRDGHRHPARPDHPGPGPRAARRQVRPGPPALRHGRGPEPGDRAGHPARGPGPVRDQHRRPHQVRGRGAGGHAAHPGGNGGPGRRDRLPAYQRRAAEIFRLQPLTPRKGG